MEEGREEKAAKGARAGHPEQDCRAGPAGQEARADPVVWPELVGASWPAEGSGMDSVGSQNGVERVGFPQTERALGRACVGSRNGAGPGAGCVGSRNGAGCVAPGTERAACAPRNGAGCVGSRNGAGCVGSRNGAGLRRLPGTERTCVGYRIGANPGAESV